MLSYVFPTSDYYIVVLFHLNVPENLPIGKTDFNGVKGAVNILLRVLWVGNFNKHVRTVVEIQLYMPILYYGFVLYSAKLEAGFLLAYGMEN